jgi:RNA polymerase sigma-70 factor, ECF subfamily
MDRSAMAPKTPVTDAAWFEHRKILVDIAYRLLGSVADAEDAVQEAFARLAAAPDQIEDVRAWLIVVVGRICLDQLGSARRRREAYVGPWLPEPLVEGEDPADQITLDDSVRMALLVVLDRLSPAERVAFVLHDVFALSFDEVGAIVGRSNAACRQLASRARHRVHTAEGLREPPVDVRVKRELAERFVAACRNGDLDELTRILGEDVTLRADGGAQVQAPRKPVRGRRRVAQIISGGAGRLGLSFAPVMVNGECGGLVYDAEHELIGVVGLRFDAASIVGIDLVANPDKLAHLTG